MPHNYPQPDVYPRQPKSKGPIVVAVVASAVFMLCLVGVVAAIVVPSLLAPRRAANEGMAIEHMRTLASAQETYFSQQAKIGGGRGKYGTLEELDAMNLLPGGLASGTVGGYRYSVRLFEDVYEATATPVSSSAGTRSFYLDANGVIYGADRKGLEASASDPPITMVIKRPETPPPWRPVKFPPLAVPSPLGRY